jgi:Phytanoyl-CoA dioxygenase (PhyH)
MPDSSSSPPQFDLEAFERDGYIVIPDFLSPETLSLLRERVVRLLEDFEPSGHPMTKFSTGEKGAHVGDEVISFPSLLISSIFLLRVIKSAISLRRRLLILLEI